MKNYGEKKQSIINQSQLLFLTANNPTIIAAILARPCKKWITLALLHYVKLDIKKNYQS